MGDIYIAAHLRRCLRHSVFGHVLQYTPSTSVLDALHLHHAIKSPPLRYPSPLHIAFIEVKNEHVKMKDVFPMKVITHTVTHQKKKTDIDTHTIMYQANFVGRQIESIMYPANFAGRYSHSIMYPANFAGGRSRLDLLLPSFLPSREEKKIQDQKNHPLGCRAQKNTSLEHPERDEQKTQDRIFCPLRGHAVGRMQYAPTTCRQESMFQIILLAGKEEKKIQDQKNRPLGSRAEKNTPPKHLGRDETKMQKRIKQSIDSGAEWHMPFMRQGERDAVWRDTFLEQRACVAIWRDRRLEEKYSHARSQLSTFGENSKPYKSSLVALSEQLRDIFAA